MYYATFSTNKQHDQRRCDYIKLEKKFGTKIWDWHVSLSIFGVSVVDTYNITTQMLSYENTYNVFLCDLDE